MTPQTAPTPGPWVVTYDKDSVPQFGVDSASKVSIADVYGWQKGKVHLGVAQANARLIASAPQLLAALRGLLDMVTDNRTHGHEVDNAVTAIDAAEGRG